MNGLGVQVKACSKCGQEKYVGQFHRRVRSKDGLQSYCKDCMRECDSIREGSTKRKHSRLVHRRGWREKNRAKINKYNREWRKNNTKRSNEHRYSSDKRHPQKRRARRAVSYMVEHGLWPPAWTMVCEVCQEAQAAHWHHHNGYNEKHKLDTIAVCVTCHVDEHRKEVIYE